MVGLAVSLKDYDENRLSYVLSVLMMRLHAAQGAAFPNSLKQRIDDITYGTQLLVGFTEGAFGGARARYRVMQDDFRRDYAAIQKLFGLELAEALGRGLAASFDEFFLRPVLESVPTGLLPKSAAAAQRLIDMFDAMALIKTLGFVDDIAKSGNFLAMLAVGVEELFELIMLEGQHWAVSVIIEPDAQRQGVMLGRPVGVALFEIVRALVEPPPLDLAHLVSSLALTRAEQQALGL